MANVYLAEGSLENAYILYMKFMTLFLEKIRKHPEYASIPAQVKVVNQAKLKEVMPKAEKLKQKLLNQYAKEYELYKESEVCNLVRKVIIYIVLILVLHVKKRQKCFNMMTYLYCYRRYGYLGL